MSSSLAIGIPGIRNDVWWCLVSNFNIVYESLIKGLSPVWMFPRSTSPKNPPNLLQFLIPKTMYLNAHIPELKNSTWFSHVSPWFAVIWKPTSGGFSRNDADHGSHREGATIGTNWRPSWSQCSSWLCFTHLQCWTADKDTGRLIFHGQKTPFACFSWWQLKKMANVLTTVFWILKIQYVYQCQ